MHFTSGLFGPRSFHSSEPIPHPTDPDATLAFAADDHDVDESERRLLQITKITEPRARRRLVEIADLLTIVRHPNLVALREVRVQSDGLYTVVDHHEGVRLSSILAESRLRSDGDPGVPVALALRITLDVLDGLSALHEVFARATPTRIHGELRPASIVVGVDGRTRIEQLGGLSAEPARSAELDRDEASYRAPEQWVGDSVDQRTDVYAAGAILWELIAGRRLFTGSRENVLFAMVRGEVPAPGGMLRVAPELFSLCRSALDPRPADRFGSALAFARAIREVVRRFSLDATRDAVSDYIETRHGDTLRARRSYLRMASSSGPPAKARPHPSVAAGFDAARRATAEPSSVFDAVTTAFQRPTTPAPPISTTMTSAVVPRASAVVQTATALMALPTLPPRSAGGLEAFEVEVAFDNDVGGPSEDVTRGRESESAARAMRDVPSSRAPWVVPTRRSYAPATILALGALALLVLGVVYAAHRAGGSNRALLGATATPVVVAAPAPGYRELPVNTDEPGRSQAELTVPVAPAAAPSIAPARPSTPLPAARGSHVSRSRGKLTAFPAASAPSQLAPQTSEAIEPAPPSGAAGAMPGSGAALDVASP